MVLGGGAWSLDGVHPKGGGHGDSVPYRFVFALFNLFSVLQNGAEFIHLPGELSRFTPDDTTSFIMNKAVTAQLILNTEKDFDVATYLGCCGKKKATCYRKGLPTENAVFSRCGPPAIQSHLVVGQAIYCNPQAPSLSIPAGTLVQFNPGVALYSHQAFWALPFVHEINEDTKFNQIWPFIVQKLLWMSGNNLMIHSQGQMVQDSMNDSDYTGILNTIMNLKCHSLKFEMCLLELMGHTADKNQFDPKILPQLHAWLQTLRNLGYSFGNTSANLKDPCLVYPTIYESVAQPRKLMTNFSSKEISNVFSNTCSTEKKNFAMLAAKITEPFVKFVDILLIVVFNTPHYQSIPYVETLYRPFFPNILYCGPGIPDFKSQSLKNLRFNFYSFGKMKNNYQAGSFNYLCMIGAINMNYPVAGFLFSSDDLIFSVSQISTFDKNRTWFFPVWDSIIDDVLDPIISLWGFKKFKTQVQSLLFRMEKHENDSSIIGQCYNQLKQLNGGPYRVNGGLADLYYIPKRLAPKIAVLGSLFLEEDIFLEIAVPTILQCTESLKNVVELIGEYRRNDKHEPWKKFTKERFFDRSYIYIHPTKWSPLSPEGHHRKVSVLVRQFFCSKVLPWLHDPQGRLPE